MINCVNCGAPVVGEFCEYCGTPYKQIPRRAPIWEIYGLQGGKGGQYANLVTMARDRCVDIYLF